MISGGRAGANRATLRFGDADEELRAQLCDVEASIGMNAIYFM